MEGGRVLWIGRVDSVKVGWVEEVCLVGFSEKGYGF